MGNNMKWLHIIAFTLVIIGGLNWGLTAIGFNVVNLVLGGIPTLEQIVYILVGVSAIYLAVTHKNDCKVCGGMMGGSGRPGMM